MKHVELIKARRTAKRLGIPTWGYMIAKNPSNLRNAIQKYRRGETL